MVRIEVGRRVIGPDGLGTVTAHVAAHDIAVECDNGTSALYCQDTTCDMYQTVYPLPKALVEGQKPTTNSASDAIALLDKLASFCERPEFGALDSITVASALRKAIARLRT